VVLPYPLDSSWNRPGQGDSQVWQKVEQENISILMFVGLIHQILHFNLLPAALVASVSHASGVLLTERGWDVLFTATPDCSDFVSEARSQSEKCKDEDQETGQTDHEK
jgi:hypothetical protein